MPTPIRTPEPPKPDIWRETKQIAGAFGLCLGIASVAVIGGTQLSKMFERESLPDLFPLSSDQVTRVINASELERKALEAVDRSVHAKKTTIDPDLDRVLKRAGMQGYSTHKPL